MMAINHDGSIVEHILYLLRANPVDKLIEHLLGFSSTIDINVEI